MQASKHKLISPKSACIEGGETVASEFPIGQIFNKRPLSKRTPQHQINAIHRRLIKVC